MWRHNEDLLLGAGEVTLDCDVHYDWSGSFGLLATIIVPTQYTAEAGFNCVEPAQPPTIHPPNIVGGTSLQICTWEANNNLQ